MSKLWRGLGRERTRTQTKSQIITPQTMKSQNIKLQSSKLRTVELQKIAPRSFSRQDAKSENAIPESIKSQSEVDGEVENKEPAPERYWACCDCSEGGMSTFIDCCSECKHYRCGDCPMELLKHRISDKSLSDTFDPIDEYA
jgi:hypothetical protein